MGKKKGKNQHVKRHKDGWAVMGEGNIKVTSTHIKQIDAIHAAKRIARNQNSKVIIDRRPYKKNNTRNKNTYKRNNDIQLSNNRLFMVVIVVILIIVALQMHHLRKNYCTSSLESSPTALIEAWWNGDLLPIKQY
jgi:hypothetical protein